MTQPLQLGNELLAQTKKILEDNENLRSQLAYALSGVDELYSQNEELWRRLNFALAELEVSSSGTDAKKPNIKSSKSKNAVRAPKATKNAEPIWISGTWLSSIGKNDLFKGPEEAWKSGNAQAALIAIDIHLHSPFVLQQDQVNLLLLKSAVMLSTNNAESALAVAEQALVKAEEWKMFNLIGKAQFFRGLNLYHLDRRSDASWCFTLASGTPGYESKVKEFKQITDGRLQKLNRTDTRSPDLYLSKDFEWVPRSQNDPKGECFPSVTVR